MEASDDLGRSLETPRLCFQRQQREACSIPESFVGALVGFGKGCDRTKKSALISPEHRQSY